MENETKPLILTTQLLLESALSLNMDLRNAAIKRIARELLNPKSTLLKISQLDFKKDFSAGEIYKTVAERALEIDTEKTWDYFFELIKERADCDGQIYLALIEICKKTKHATIASRCHDFMRDVPENPWDETILIEFIVNYRCSNFMVLAKARLKKASPHTNLIDYFTNEMVKDCFDDILDLISILDSKYKCAQNLEIFKYLINVLNKDIIVSQPDTPRLSELQKQRILELIASSLNCFSIKIEPDDVVARIRSSARTHIHQEIRVIHSLLKTDNLDPVTALRITEKIAKGLASNECMAELFDIVYKAIEKTPEVISLALACIAPFEGSGSYKSEVLWICSRLYGLLTNEKYQARFPKKDCSKLALEFSTVYWRNVQAVGAFEDTRFGLIARLWLKKNKEIFWATVKHAAEKQYPCLLQLILQENPRYFKSLCHRLNLNLIKNKISFISDLIEIIKIHPEKTAQKELVRLLENFVKKQVFSGVEIKDLRRKLDGSSLFKNVVFIPSKEDAANNALIALIKGD